MNRAILTPTYFAGRGITDPTPYEDNRPPEDLGTCPICGETIAPGDRVWHIDILSGRTVHEDCAVFSRLSLSQLLDRLDLDDVTQHATAKQLWEEGVIVT